jgi:phage FluMu protein Com
MMISFTKIKMSQIQIQQQYQLQNRNPLDYFANTPRSIQRRKRQATRQSNMKIVDFTQNPHNNSFNVLIKGHRGITYEVFFSDSAITCSCPDYEKHTVKPICKHMFKLICLSENHDIFNNSMLLTDLMNPQYLARILESTLRIIDVKKMERYGSPRNQISIERDECCPVCYGDFDMYVSKCSKCKHVFHINCVYLSWNSSAYHARGKCPMCRELNSFPELHGGNRNYDPWEIYNFPPAPAPEENLIENPPPAPAQQDELIEENHDDLLLNNGFLPIENNNDNDAIFHPLPPPEIPEELFLPLEDNSADGGPNENPDGTESTSSAGVITSEEEDYDVIDRRIKILNISLFILETINIIFNQQEQPE